LLKIHSKGWKLIIYTCTIENFTSQAREVQGAMERTTAPAPTREATGLSDPARRPGASRAITHHRALPSSRAVVGALLITLAAVGAFALGQRGDGRSATQYVVVTKALAPGVRVDASAVATRPMQLDADVASHAYTDVQQVIGSVALAHMGTGQLVQRADLAPPNRVDGAVLAGHELTFPVERDRVPANLRRGERIAVLATYGTGNDARTTTTAQRAVVLAFDTDGDAIGAARTARLTVLVDDPSMVIETAHASQAADLTIVRTTQADVALPSTFRTDVAPTSHT
jgi:hypothetical protein